MGMIPLMQTITLYPPGSSHPWSLPSSESPKMLKCRIQEQLEVVTDVHGRQAVSTAQIWLKGFAEVSASHTIKYTDESGHERDYHIVQILRKRWLNGKTAYTVVHAK